MVVWSGVLSSKEKPVKRAKDKLVLIIRQQNDFHYVARYLGGVAVFFIHIHAVAVAARISLFVESDRCSPFFVFQDEGELPAAPEPVWERRHKQL